MGLGMIPPEVMAYIPLVEALAITIGFVFFAYLFVTLDRKRENSPAKDDTQVGIKIVLYALALAGIQIAATGVDGLLTYVLGGWTGLVWGFCIGQMLCWHATYTINSLAHLWGARRYATSDDSRNNLLLALITMGEGWHNNHHHYQVSARQGFFWWELDLTYYVLRGLAAVGLIWGLRVVPDHVRADGRADSEPLGVLPAPAQTADMA